MAKGRRGRGVNWGVVFCAFIPWIVLIVGFVLGLKKNTRVQRINEYFRSYIMTCRYNARAKVWMSSGITQFKDITFRVNNQKMWSSNSTGGVYYPVRDSCDKKGDPEERCLAADSHYYYQSVEKKGESVTVRVTQGDDEIVERTYPASRSVNYDASDLLCEEAIEYLRRQGVICRECSGKCLDKGGEWDGRREICTVTQYLYRICYRVNKVKDTWQLDYPSYVLSVMD